MRIRTKLGLFTGLIVILTTAAIASLGYLLQQRLIRQNLDEGRTVESSNFAAICRQALTLNNDLLMVNYVKLLQESPGIAYAYFVDSGGKIWVHSDGRFFYKPISDWRAPAGTMENPVPVFLGRRRAGNAVVGFSQAYQEMLLKRALGRTVKQVSIAASAVAAIGLTAALLFSYLLTRPLKALYQGSEQIAKGHFRTEVRVSSRDEIGELTNRFNLMTRSLAVLDEIKDEFISSVSHDLKSPLAAIEMYVDFMLNTDPDRNKITPKHRDILITIIDNARRLGLFIGNVLDLAKIKAGRAQYVVAPVSLEVVAQHIQNLFGIVAQKSGAMLMADIPKNLPPVSADPQQFEQAVANLVSNALKFTSAGGRIILAGRERGEKIEVSVSDTGKGIPPENLPMLFQQFYRIGLHEQQTKGVKGTGLGLFIVKKNIEEMNGTVAVESKINQGTRFVITLPKA